MKAQLDEALEARDEIINATKEQNYDALKLVEAEYLERLEPLRLVGNLALKCFFEGKNEKDRTKNLEKHSLVISNYFSVNDHERLEQFCRDKPKDSDSRDTCLRKLSRTVVPGVKQCLSNKLGSKGVKMNPTKEHDERIANMTFSSVYPHYLTKIEKKGRTKSELHQVISWLTGFNEKTLQKYIQDKSTFEQFFKHASLNANAHLITGVICGYRIEDIKNPLTRKARYLDKLVDELAKGRKMEKVLRSK